MLEGQRVAAYVFDALKADNGAGGVNTLVGGRIYRDRVPRTVQTWPAVVVSLVSHVDESTLGGDRVYAVTLVDVRVVSEGGAYSNSVGDRIDTVLQGLSVSSGSPAVRIVKLRRDGVQAFLEDDEGKTWAHLIQTFRTEAHAA